MIAVDKGRAHRLSCANSRNNLRETALAIDLALHCEGSLHKEAKTPSRTNGSVVRLLVVVASWQGWLQQTATRFDTAFKTGDTETADAVQYKGVEAPRIE